MYLRINLHVYLCSFLLMFLVSCGDTTVPDAPSMPSDLSATVGAGKIVLNWQDTSDNETGFSIFRQTMGSEEDFAKIGSVAANVTTYEDTAVSAGVSYRYGVTADSVSGNSQMTSLEEDEAVSPANSAPSAEAKEASTQEDTSVTLELSGDDPENSALSFAIVRQPTMGTLGDINQSTGEVTYTPNANASGEDSFAYRVNDGELDSETATVTITVRGENDAPVAEAQELSTTEDTALVIYLSGSDIDSETLSYAIVTAPTKGTLSEINQDTGEVTYTPNANVSGEDSFVYSVSDGEASDEATITLNLGVVNEPPVAQPRSITLDEDTSRRFTLMASDPDGDALNYAITDGPKHGTLEENFPQVTYTPKPNYSGEDSFSFKVNDGNDDSDVVSVSITVKPVNDAPDSLSLSNTSVDENAPAGTVVGYFSTTDSDSNSFRYQLVAGEGDSGNRAFSVKENKLETLTPLDFEEQDSYSIRVRVSDDDGATLEKIFSITVNDLDDSEEPDETDPTITFDNPGELTLNETVTLTGTVGDDSELSKVELYEGKDLLGEAILSGDAWSFDYTPDTLGDIKLTAVATDKAGNSAEISVMVSVKDSVVDERCEETVLTPEFKQLDFPSFGENLAADGNTLLVSATDSEAGQVGNVYVFVCDDGTWTEQAQLGDLVDLGSEFFFGSSIALSGDTAVVNGPVGDNARAFTSAYVFVRDDDGTWRFETSLTLDGEDASELSSAPSVAISDDGNTVVLGVEREFDDNDGDDEPSFDDTDFKPGSVFVFERDGSEWVQTAKIRASDPQQEGLFGLRVVLDGSRLYVETDKYREAEDDVVRDAIYVFEREGSSWSEKAVIAAESGAAIRDFDARADTLAVAYEGDDGTWTVELYGYSDGVVTELTTLQDTMVDAGDPLPDFGEGLDFSEDGKVLAVYSAYGGRNAEETDAAIIFKRESGAWTEINRFTVSTADREINGAIGDIALANNVLFASTVVTEDVTIFNLEE